MKTGILAKKCTQRGWSGWGETLYRRRFKPNPQALAQVKMEGPPSRENSLEKKKKKQKRVKLCGLMNSQINILEWSRVKWYGDGVRKIIQSLIEKVNFVNFNL